jgi:hypothetical protein
VTDESLGLAPFAAHIELLQLFIAHRDEIVEQIEGILNAQRKPIEYLRDRPLLSRRFEDCFFALTAVTSDQSELRGQLERAHWQSGFRPRQAPGLHNDLIHPGEMVIRGFHCWQQTRWPGRNGRLRYAHMLFNVYLLRCLTLLSMRLWDAGPDGAGPRLTRIQGVLDELWTATPADQPVLVRDARWLIPLAQSPTTDELAAYFEVAERVARSLAPQDRIEVQRAHVRMLGGHLTSQIRHYCMNDGVTFDEHSVVLRTRTSNALDFALLIQGLVPLLAAYEQARQSGDDARSFELAGAICQGISADPEVFLNRLDLLAPYSMIEHLFVTTEADGRAVYSSMGQRHLELLREYQANIGRVARLLAEDCRRFRPREGSYSPFGAIFGTPSTLTELLALKTLQRDAVTRFSLEDAFVDADPAADRLAWADGWRKLPHIDRAVQKLYDYPQQFAADLFERIEQALQRSVADRAASGRSTTGRLYLSSADDAASNAETAQIPELPIRYIGSSDKELVRQHKAEPYDAAQLQRDRQEGHFILSFETAGGWVALKKNLLTEVLGAGHDARLTGLPPAAARVLQLTCPGLVVADDGSA